MKRRCFIEVRLVSHVLERRIAAMIARDLYEYRSDRIRLVDPEDRRLRHIHQRLKVRNLKFVLRRFARMQCRRRDSLPLIFEVSGVWVLWNGHHRAFAARLLGRRLRARVISLR